MQQNTTRIYFILMKNNINLITYDFIFDILYYFIIIFKIQQKAIKIYFILM